MIVMPSTLGDCKYGPLMISSIVDTSQPRIYVKFAKPYRIRYDESNKLHL